MELQSLTETDARAAGASTGSPSGLIDARHPQRREVESFVAQRFLEVHGARINGFMPQLLALFDDAGKVTAAVGMRSARLERLFLEYYLDIPAEQAIAESAGAMVTRERIVEIGNLASRDRRASRLLFRLLARQLYRERFEWAVFTGCSSLQRMFATLGIETPGLGCALQAKLPADQQTWGSYYEDNPQVVAGRIDCGLEIFERLAT